MRTYRTEGIIIKRINFGETDRIITILTKHYGKIRVIAKGVRKIKSRRASHLELFNQVVIFLHQSRGIDIISEAQLLKSFANFKKDLKRVGFAFEVCEVVDQLTWEGQDQRQVYKLLVDCLDDLNHLNNGSGRVVKSFKRNLLEILGFLPKKASLEKVDLTDFIEKLIEKKLKSKKFLDNLW